MPKGIYKHHPQQGFQKGFKHSEETIEKMRISHLGKQFTKEHIKHMSKNNFWRGKKGKNAFHWKGGKIKDISGYILIYKPEHPFCDNNSYVREHRLVMEKHLGWYLRPKEVVHHINEIYDDNRIENLMLFANKGYHNAFHRFGYCNFKGIIFNGNFINES